MGEWCYRREMSIASHLQVEPSSSSQHESSLYSSLQGTTTETSPSLVCHYQGKGGRDDTRGRNEWFDQKEQGSGQRWPARCSWARYGASCPEVFFKKYQFQPCVLFICTTASAAIYVFLLFYIKASWRSSFTVVNKAFMPKYWLYEEVFIKIPPKTFLGRICF